jgi:hypothetical protein
MDAEEARHRDEAAEAWNALLKDVKLRKAFMLLYKRAVITDILIGSKRRDAAPLPEAERAAAIGRHVDGLTEREAREQLKKLLLESYELPSSAFSLLRFAVGQRAEGRRYNAVQSAKAKLARDPKQLAKAEAFRLWCEWQAGAARYKSGAAFARHVVDTLPIESTKSVERWMATWHRQHTRTAS